MQGIKMMKRKKLQDDFNDTKSIIENRTHEQERQTDKKLKGLLKSSRDFQTSRIDLAERSEKRAWKIAYLGMGIGFAGVLAVACLAPFKTAVPYLLRYNSETGYTDLAPVYKSNSKTLGDNVDKYFISRYVQYRESYDWSTIQDNVDFADLLSTQNVFSEFNAFIHSNNSPVKILGVNKKIKVDVISVSFLGDVAQVRYRKTVLDSNGQPSSGYTPINYIANVKYDYDKKIVYAKDAVNVNPVGFEITAWNTSPENVDAGS